MHCLIVGISYSGKSHLAHRLATDFIESGKKVVVFDPLKSGEWPKGAKCYSNLKAFSRVLETTESAFVFIDEAKTVFNEDPKLAEKWLYLNRHKGQYFFVIAQRAKMVPPNARCMCTRVFAFRQTKDDAKALADDFTDEIMAITKLPKTEYIFSDGFDTQMGKLNFDTKPPRLVYRT